MSNTAAQLKISIDEYLENELMSEIKHEYINNVVYAMPKTNHAHNLIARNLLTFLHNHLQTTPCRAFSSDMKVGIFTASDEIFYYPDVQVSCEQHGHYYHTTEPKLVIEVLSDSTERKDRVEKFHDYRKLVSLEEYVLVAQDCLRIEIYRKRNGWDVELLGEEQSFQFESVGLNLTVADVYQDVEF